MLRNPVHVAAEYALAMRCLQILQIEVDVVVVCFASEESQCLHTSSR